MRVLRTEDLVRFDLVLVMSLLINGPASVALRVDVEVAQTELVACPTFQSSGIIQSLPQFNVSWLFPPYASD